MSAFIGEIRIMPYGFAPDGWAQCDGQQLDVGTNQALFSIIGNTFGGGVPDDTHRAPWFNLPDMRASVPIGMGAGPGLTPRTIGPKSVGEASVTLKPDQLPAHSHPFSAQVQISSDLVADPTDAWLVHGVVEIQKTPAKYLPFSTYTPAVPAVAFDAAAISPFPAAGETSGGPHENRQPYLAFNFCICLNGDYPTRP